MWVIVGKYLNHAKEDIDEFATLDEARKMLSEYRLAYGQGWYLAIKFKKGGMK